MLNKWSMDIFKKSLHKAKLIIDKPRWELTCMKCTGNWIMRDKKGMEPIFKRPYITCPHCAKRGKLTEV